MIKLVTGKQNAMNMIPITADSLVSPVVADTVTTTTRLMSAKQI